MTTTVCVLVGSPRRNGACAALARCVAQGVQRAGAVATTAYLADYALAGCIGCGACNRTGSCVFDAREAEASRPGFAALFDCVRRADALALVAPVYFSGPPSQLKAFFDRMQPLWAQRYVLNKCPTLPMGERRPFDLYAVGAGGDPFGYDALVSCARSSLRMADLELRELHDCIGYGTPGSDGTVFERRAQDGGAQLAQAARVTLP